MAAQACAASTTSVGPAHPRVSADSRGPARLRRLRVIPRASADSVAAPPAPLPPRGQAPRSPLLRVAIPASTAAEAVSGPVWFGCMHMHLIPILRVTPAAAILTATQWWTLIDGAEGIASFHGADGWGWETLHITILVFLEGFELKILVCYLGHCNH
uniref:Uncharacterized protein n=1 Tax=Oryza sativa subsp. japonica TaxID=39947 RepID=Q2R2F2_ORYSJ|nr:hypothetical protein LOC_Os11g36010 [Oryza sativa Japonica Group]